MLPSNVGHILGDRMDIGALRGHLKALWLRRGGGETRGGVMTGLRLGSGRRPGGEPLLNLGPDRGVGLEILARMCWYWRARLPATAPGGPDGAVSSGRPGPPPL